MESINKTQYIYRRTQGVMSFAMYFGITLVAVVVIFHHSMMAIN